MHRNVRACLHKLPVPIPTTAHHHTVSIVNSMKCCITITSTSYRVFRSIVPYTLQGQALAVPHLTPNAQLTQHGITSLHIMHACALIGGVGKP